MGCTFGQASKWPKLCFYTGLHLVQTLCVLSQALGTSRTLRLALPVLAMLMITECQCLETRTGSQLILFTFMFEVLLVLVPYAE